MLLLLALNFVADFVFAHAHIISIDVSPILRPMPFECRGHTERACRDRFSMIRGLFFLLLRVRLAVVETRHAYFPRQWLGYSL